MANKAGSIQGLSLLFAAFVALGLDSYLFGLVTGDSTNVMGKVSACRRTWTEATLAGGLLAIGAVAIIVGFVFLFAVYIRDIRRDDELESSIDLLEMLCGVLRAGVALVVVAVLFMTARSYLHAIFPVHVPMWDKVFLYAYLVIGLLAVVIFGVAITAPLRKRDRQQGRVLSKLRADEEAKNDKFIRTLKFAIYSSVGYSVVTVIAVTIAAASPIGFWNPAHASVKAVAFATVIWISLVSLVPVLLLTWRAVPAFDRSGNESPNPRVT